MHTPVEAARIAGLGARTGTTSKVEKRKQVQERINWLTRQPEETIQAKRLELERWLWMALRYDPMIFWEGNRLKDWSEIEPEFRTLIEGLTFTEKGKPNLKIVGRMDAHMQLRKMLGGDAPVKIAPTDPSGEHEALIAPVINLIGHSDRPEDEAA